MERFRLLPSTIDDFDTTTVRIEKNEMEKLGIHDGDTIKITGMQSSGAICRAVENGFKMSNDSEITYLSNTPVILPSIRVGNFVGQNINRHGAGLIPVSIEKICDGTRLAHKVCLMSLNSNSDNEQFDKSKLDRLIVSKNNRLNFRDYDPKKNFGYQVTCVEPTDYSQITKDTIVEFVTINSDVIHSFFGKIKLEKLQNVVPIVYQETLNNVDVIIPSLEIFDTGIRFYLYLKSNFDQHKVIPQGSASVVVTLNDDLGNSYDLGSHGGGGSHSPQGFDYRYEFHGKQLHSDAKHLTIMLHEILIQERFPREDPGSSFSRRPMMGTKDEYANVEKFPSFFIISGPWKSTFSLNRNQSN